MQREDSKLDFTGQEIYAGIGTGKRGQIPTELLGLPDLFLFQIFWL